MDAQALTTPVTTTAALPEGTGTLRVKTDVMNVVPLTLVITQIAISAVRVWSKRDLSDLDVNGDQFRKYAELHGTWLHREMIVSAVASGVLTGILCVQFPSLISFPIQIFTAVVVYVLDWISFYQDKSRYSESRSCMIDTSFNFFAANCRENALITGILAHSGDILGILLLIYGASSRVRVNPNSNQSTIEGGKSKNNMSVLLPDRQGTISVMMKVALSIILIVIAGAGGYLIYELTRSGSVSDLRPRDDSETSPCDMCAKSRGLMNDDARGYMNVALLYLGGLMFWQGLFSGLTDADVAKWKRGSPVMAFLTVYKWLPAVGKSFIAKDSTTAIMGLLRALIMLFLTVTAVLLPVYATYVNTKFQFSANPSELCLPQCFSDFPSTTCEDDPFTFCGSCKDDFIASGGSCADNQGKTQTDSPAPPPAESPA